MNSCARGVPPLATFPLIHVIAATTRTPQDHEELKQDYVQLEGLKGGVSGLSGAGLGIFHSALKEGMLTASVPLPADLACSARFYLLHRRDCKVLGRLLQLPLCGDCGPLVSPGNSSILFSVIITKYTKAGREVKYPKSPLVVSCNGEQSCAREGDVTGPDMKSGTVRAQTCPFIATVL